MMKKMLIAGGTGLLGKSISMLARTIGWEVTVLSRTSGIGRIKWDPSSGEIDLEGKNDFDAIINLTGESISGGRWTKNKKHLIYQSRINSCRTLASYLESGVLSANIYLGASGIGIYRDHGTEVVTEETPIDTNDWFTQLVIDWESAHKQISSWVPRIIIFRIGIVVSMDGGALYELIQKSKIGILSFFGDGSQIWPWIHIKDLASMVLFCLNQSDVSGIFNATAPNPVSNRKLVETIQQHQPRKLIAGVPRFLLALILGEMHTVLFDSCKAVPDKIQAKGFQFEFNTIEEAMEDLLNTPNKQ